MKSDKKILNAFLSPQHKKYKKPAERIKMKKETSRIQIATSGKKLCCLLTVF
jgi:hypothetical protein